MEQKLATQQLGLGVGIEVLILENRDKVLAA